jgi:hypothetical protein
MMEGEPKTCWQVEATDSFSTPGILELNAVEYYANETTDDVDNGIVDAFVVKPVDPNPDVGDECEVFGFTFIKPKKEYEYFIYNSLNDKWYLDNNLPVTYKTYRTDEGYNAIKLIWSTPMSG